MPWQHPTTTPPLCGICAQPASAHHIKQAPTGRWWAYCTHNGPISDLTQHQEVLANTANGTPQP